MFENTHSMGARSSDIHDSGRLFAAQVFDEAIHEHLLLLDRLELAVARCHGNQHRMLPLLVHLPRHPVELRGLEPHPLGYADGGGLRQTIAKGTSGNVSGSGHEVHPHFSLVVLQTKYSTPKDRVFL